MSHALLRNVAIIFGVVVPNIVVAQEAPLTDSHYGGRATDTGYGGTVTPSGGYQASIPFDLPPTRDGTPIPFQLVSSGKSAGAAGPGWDVPLSFIHVDNTYVHRKPYGLEPLNGVQSNQQVFMSLNGQTMQLIPTQSGWAARANAPMLSAQHATSTAPWIVNDGYGRTYTFTQPSGFGYLGIWLLTSVAGPSGPIMTVTYSVADVFGTETFVSIDLATIDYNVSSTLGCAKNEIKLDYNADGSPLSLSILGFNVLTRLHTLANVLVQSRPDCSSFTALRTYELTYVADADTGMSDRLSSVNVVGRTGTPESSTPIPIASYTYTAATTNLTGAPGRFISFDATSSISMPSHQNFDATVISSTAQDFNAPIETTDGTPYSTYQNLIDMTGDGIPDFVFQDPVSLALMIAKGVPTPSGMSFDTPMIMGDDLTVIGPLEDMTITSPRFEPQPKTVSHEDVWRKAIDINGDGRIDIIDAAAKPGQWTVYLNTPYGNGGTGIAWEMRAIPISNIANMLVGAGHVLSDPNYLPIERSSTTVGYEVLGDNTTQLPGPNDTFTEWRLQDVNGDGYPDFVYNTQPAQYYEYGTLGSNGAQLFYGELGGGANDVDVLLNIGGIQLSDDCGSACGSGTGPLRTIFADPQSPLQMLENDGCGIELWNDGQEECTLVDATGDGIVDRLENGVFTIGLGGNESWFSSQTFPLPGGTTISRTSPPPASCATTFGTTIDGGLRDVTGDGIPDVVVGTNELYVGTGAGFVGPVAISPNLDLSVGTEQCDGTKSTTTGGFFDIDGDGRPEYVYVTGGSNPALGVESLSDTNGNPIEPGTGDLVSVSNGYGATTSITYVSAKQQDPTLSSHDVPFPEIVVGTVATTRTSDTTETKLAPTTYAYSGATMGFDNTLEAFIFSGYTRVVAIQGPISSLDPHVATAYNATVTQYNQYAPVDCQLSEGCPIQIDSDRYLQRAGAGTVAQQSVMSGVTDGNPWDLAADNPAADPLTEQFSQNWFANSYVDEGTTGAFPDCVEYMDPYDFDDSYADACPGGNCSAHYNPCSTHGFVYASIIDNSRGLPAWDPTASVKTETQVTGVDQFGRTTDVSYLNDVATQSDDLCVHSDYATPTGGTTILGAVSATTTSYCGVEGSSLPLSVVRYNYDSMPNGSVSTGLVTNASTDRYSTNDGTYINTIDVFDATYNASGTLHTRTRTRSLDGATQTTSYTYDPFDLAISTVSVVGGSTTLASSTVRDPLSLMPTSTTDANGTSHGTAYDGFDRPMTTTLALPGGASGTMSTIEYLGFSPASLRRVRTTVYDDPASGSGSIGHSGTTYFDEIGRPFLADSDLGSDYSTGVLQTRIYDSLGRVAFESDPFPETTSPSDAYGTSRFYHSDGTPDCFVRATGFQFIATSDTGNEAFATCFEHGYASSTEVFQVLNADANVLSGPQAGVFTTETRTAIGRRLTTSTSQSDFLEYSAYAQDPLGHLTSITRYGNPASQAGPVQTTWTRDSFGQALETQGPAGAPINTTYDSWGEPTTVEWHDTIADTVDHSLVSDYDALGRITHREERANGSADPATLYDYTYDAGSVVAPEVSPTNLVGRLSSASGPTGTAYFSYDGLGAVNARVDFDEDATRYVTRTNYHANGNPLSLILNMPDDAYADEEVDYSYDSAARPVGLAYTSPTSNITLFDASASGDIDPLGRLLSATYGVASYTADYATTGRQLLQDVSVGAAPRFGRGTSLGITFTGYDPVGRELGRQESSQTLFTTLTNFSESYDQLGRISTMTAGTSWQYQYDSLGNAKVLEASDASGSDALGAAISYVGVGDSDQMCQIAYGTASVPGNSYCTVQHDDAGNVISEPTRTGSRTFSYFANGSIRTIDDGSSTATFRYDPFGAVQELDVDGPTDDNRRDRHYGSLVDIAGTTSPVISREIPGPGGLVASLRGTDGTWVFGFGEQRGFRFAFDQNGNLLQKLGYQPFGEATTDTATPGTTTYTPNQWNGGDDLAAFNLVHVGARVYDPVVGRFLSRDALTDTSTSTHANAYAFAVNDPINHSDPSGLDCEGCPPPDLGDGPAGGVSVGAGASNSNGWPAGPSTDALSTGGITVTKTTFTAATAANLMATVMLAAQSDAAANADVSPCRPYDYGCSLLRGSVDGIVATAATTERLSKQYSAIVYGIPDDGTSAIHDAWAPYAAPSGSQNLAYKVGTVVGPVLLTESAALGLGAFGTDVADAEVVANDGIFGSCPGGVCDGTCFVSGTLVATAAGEEPIETLRVGDRIMADNAACDNDTLQSSAVTISLVIEREHHPDVIHATVVRPWHWLFDQPLNAGRLWVDIPEVGVGWARVVSVTPAPREVGGPGCLVLATVDHMADRVLRISLSDGDSLELTPTHPLYVEGNGWTVAGALHVGDILRARTADVVVRGVDEAPTAQVFNIEVDLEHSYRVGKSGVWAHNTCPPFPNGTPSPALKGSPYDPEIVESRIRPPYNPNPAHNPFATHGSFRTPEPADAADVYQTAVRGHNGVGGTGTWWGRGASGWYRYFSDNAGTVHFSGIMMDDDVPIGIRRAP
jgi:RHS repeat-associated protein